MNEGVYICIDFFKLIFSLSADVVYHAVMWYSNLYQYIIVNSVILNYQLGFVSFFTESNTALGL